MNPPKKAAALAAGLAAALTVPLLTTSLVAQSTKAGPETLVVEEASVDWIERSNVAALREGVIEKMELQIGMEVAKNKPIGYLHREMADLAIKKAEVAARSEGPKAKAQAQQDLALAVVAINKRLNGRIKGSVSYEEQQKAEAELKVATASILEAQERILLDEAELNLAKQAYLEHTIVAPFDGIIIERIKNPGESVRANEPVVKLGNLSKLRVWGYIPLEYAYRVKEGQVVEFQPRLVGERHVPLPIEQKRFRGKVTFVDPQIQPIAETAVRVYTEFENKDFELRPGLKGMLTIFLNSEGSAPESPAPAVGARPNPSGIGR
jgi:RND family efflux transporter MFP subunit